MKKRTCFHCGTPGHISINCSNRTYVPYYAQGWNNATRGRFYKRNPSRPCSVNGDRNAKKGKNQTLKVKKEMPAKKPNSKDAPMKPRPVKAKPSQRPVSSSKTSIEASIRSNRKWVKPNYKWVKKVHTPKSSNDSNISSSSICDKKDMSWERITCTNDKGQPSFKMDWVPKTN